MKSVNLNRTHNNEPEKKEVIIRDGSSASFAQSFTFIGSIMGFLLDDATDFKSREKKASNSVGPLFFCGAQMTFYLRRR